MQEIDIENNLEFLKSLNIEDIMPKNILYPDQQLNLAGSSSNFSNFTNSAGLDNTFSKNLKFDKNSLTKISFSNEPESTVYDVILEGQLVIACGGNFIKIYKTSNLSDADFTFFCIGEDFYRVALTEIQSNSGKSKLLLAAGGKKSIIKVLDLTERKELEELIGHRNEIYDLKFSRNRKNFLLSASHDFSIRLWNVLNGVQISIFGGPYGHSAEVLSLDWHPSSKYFVSSGVDYYIKIWTFNKKVLNAI